MQGVGNREQGKGNIAPVRGTQSFVGVMAEVFKRPSLVGLEIAWRWPFALVVLSWAWFWHRAALLSYSRLDWKADLTIAMHGSLIIDVTPRAVAIALATCLIGAAVSGLGRDVLLRRIDPALSSRKASLASLAMLRVLALTLVFTVWVRVLVKSYAMAVSGPMARGEYPSYVPGFAVVVCATLVLFVLWSVGNWVFRIAPVLAMSGGYGIWRSLTAALRLGPLRGKLIEINLVMGIVKVALLVLALVFSACPLPFSSVETQEFLNWWWAGVALLWVVASDYFHVVRAAAYVRLWQAYEGVTKV